jgi:endo-1,4-beta-xylanase
MKKMRFLSITCALFFFVTYAKAQSLPVIVEAESGNAGNDWQVRTEANVKFVTTQTDFASRDFPGGDHKVITYKITFPKAGTYDLYARVRVGSGGGDDDSFYYAKGFGSKTATADYDEWVMCNGLLDKGYADAQASTNVDDAGATGVAEWKWINISKFNGGEPSVNFKVKESALTQTFQIGGRENGLDIDKFAFGLSSEKYTVQILNTATGK